MCVLVLSYEFILTMVVYLDKIECVTAYNGVTEAE